MYARTIRKHFPEFSYLKCYSACGRVKYWLPKGVQASGPGWAAMVAELRQQGVKHVRMLTREKHGTTGLALYFRNTHVPS